MTLDLFERPVQIVSYLGNLFISPVMPELHDELYFWHRKTKMGERKFHDKSGEEQTIQYRTDQMEHTKEPLFTVSEDGEWTVTHEGLLRRILKYLDKQRRPYTYERRGPQFPVFEWGDWVVAGLRPEQIQAVIHLIGHEPRIKAPLSGAMVEFTMATGKTHIIKALCLAFRRYKIVVTTFKTSVVRRLYDGLRELLEPLGISVGIVQGSIRKFAQVTVCTDALLEEFDPEEVGVVIYDEVHRAAADRVSNRLFEFTRALRYGFSGTIKKRADGKNKYLEALFGPIVYEYTDQEAERDKRVSPVKCFALSVPKGPRVADKSDTMKERHGIMWNKMRNKLIRQVVDLVPPEQQVIVFVRTIQHIDHLKELYLPSDFVVYHGDMTGKERKTIEEGITSGTIRRIVANDALSEGVDTTEMDVVIDAAWTVSDKDVSQKGGRNRRMREGKRWGVIVNFRDEWGELARQATLQERQMLDIDVAMEEGLEKPDPLFRRAQARLKQYRDRGWPVFEIDSPTQIEFDRRDQVVPAEQG